MRAFMVMQSLLWAALAVSPLLASAGARAEAPLGVQFAQSQSAAASGVGTLTPEAQSLYELMHDEKPPRALVEQLYEDPGNARAPMLQYLATGDTSPEARARRAAVLAAGIIDRGHGDPETRDRLIDTLLQLASEVVCSTRCIGTEIVEGYVPPASSFAFDYGGPASLVAKGFTLVTPDSSMFQGQVRDMEGLGTGALLYDAVSGVTRILINVPNGSYILRIFLPQGGNGEIYDLRVNGTTHHVAWNDKSQWPAGSPLVTPNGEGGGGPPIAGYACKMPLGARVAGGEVVIEFDGTPDPFPISGVELKPYDPLNDELGEDECLTWDDAQRDAIAAYQEGGGTGDDPEIEIPNGCVGDCPVEDPEDPSPSGAT